MGVDHGKDITMGKRIALATRPEPYKPLLRRSLKLYQASIFHVFFLSLLISVIAFVPRLFSLLIGQEVFYSLPYYHPAKLWIILIDLFCLFFFIALLWRVRCVMTEIHEKILDDVKIAFEKLPLIVAAVIIQLIIFTLVGVTVYVFFNFLSTASPGNGALFHGNFLVMFALIGHVLLAVYLFFLFIFYLVLILTEDKGVFSSIKKSTLLVWRNWWRTFWFQMTPILAYIICLMIIKYVLHLNIHIYFTGPPSQFSWWTTFLHILLFALFLPWTAAVLLVQLRDLELRKKNALGKT